MSDTPRTDAMMPQQNSAKGGGRRQDFIDLCRELERSLSDSIQSQRTIAELAAQHLKDLATVCDERDAAVANYHHERDNNLCIDCDGIEKDIASPFNACQLRHRCAGAIELIKCERDRALMDAEAHFQPQIDQGIRENNALTAYAGELADCVRGLLACADDPLVNGYDGATTRVVARAVLAKGAALSKNTGTPKPSGVTPYRDNDTESGKGTDERVEGPQSLDGVLPQWAGSGNYTANDDTFPTRVTFANGRTVAVQDGHLVVGMDLTDAERYGTRAMRALERMDERVADLKRPIDLTEYPNLEAILSGRVSGQLTEWPAIRGELRNLLDRYCVPSQGSHG